MLDQTTQMVDTGGHGFKIPLIKENRPGKAMDITIPVEEGRLYHLNKINFVGIKLFRTPETLMRPLFGMTEGDVFSTAKLRKGLENMRKLYGEFGYIDFVPEPDFNIIHDSDKVDLTLTADEGKQFFVRRIDFSGNLTTRDKVIRREILLDEGDIFNNRLWELSILRLNQLGYFEQLKAEEAADIKRNTQNNTVDMTLKVKERGKNSIGLNGGVSGIAGSFIGANYSTNNFLGLGETLSLNSQLGTRLDSVSAGFTEPYFLDRPLQLGVEVHLTRFDYNQGREASILAGENLIPLYNQLGPQNLLNYVQNGHGFSVSASYPLRRSFSRDRHHVRVRRLEYHDSHHGFDVVFRLHQLQRNIRAQCAARYSHQPHRTLFLLQYGQPSDHANRRQEPVHFDFVLRQHPGWQRQHDSTDHRGQVLQAGALAA